MLVYHHSENLIGLVDKIDDQKNFLQLGKNDSKNSIPIAVNVATALMKRNDLPPGSKINLGIMSPWFEGAVSGLEFIHCCLQLL